MSGNFPGIKESQLQKVFGNVHFVSLHETRRNHASRHWRAHVTVAEGLDTPRKMKKREHRAQSKARAKEREREPLRGCALKPGGRKRERERSLWDGYCVPTVLYCVAEKGPPCRFTSDNCETPTSERQIPGRTPPNLTMLCSRGLLLLCCRARSALSLFHSRLPRNIWGGAERRGKGSPLPPPFRKKERER